MSPLVSVVIACKDAELTLGVQLAALARQECPVDWNVVISDNGSTDGTLTVARSYAKKLPGLVIVDSSEQAGPGYARNVGARATQAPFLVFCDADDEVAPGWLATMVAALRRDAFVAGRFEASRLNSARILRSRPLQQSDGLQESPFGPGLPHAGAGNMGVHRDVFFAVDGFDPTVGCLEDTDLCWRIQLTGVPLVFCPEAAVHVRLRSSLRSMWSQGRAYGEASALLTDRYPAASTASADHGTPERRRGPRSTALAALTLLRQQRSPGALAWSVAWHVGHRRRQRRTTPPEPGISAAGSPAVDAA